MSARQEPVPSKRRGKTSLSPMWLSLLAALVALAIAVARRARGDGIAASVGDEVDALARRAHSAVAAGDTAVALRLFEVVPTVRATQSTS